MFTNTATMEGLHHWFKHKFEELGWMVLAKNRSSTDPACREKVKAYKLSLVSLKNHLKDKIEKIHEQDRKDDLLILHSHVCELIDFTTKHLGSKSRSSSKKVSKRQSRK